VAALRLPFLINSIELGTTTSRLVGLFHTKWNTTLKISQVGYPTMSRVRRQRKWRHMLPRIAPSSMTRHTQIAASSDFAASSILLDKSCRHRPQRNILASVRRQRLQRCVSASSVFFDVDQ
jgi:hypothetical protein